MVEKEKLYKLYSLSGARIISLIAVLGIRNYNINKKMPDIKRQKITRKEQKNNCESQGMNRWMGKVDSITGEVN